MRQLRLVGPGDEGACLILETSDGAETFTVPIDEAIRAAVKPAAPKPVVTSDAGSLRPREIQMRVRGGTDPQTVADEAGATLDKVMRFAYPVLQERIRVTDEARRGRVRRGGEGTPVNFGELVEARFAALGVDAAAVVWDSFRREDGGWTVTAMFTAEQRELTARFSFALTTRTVSPLNETAADLLSEGPLRELIRPQRVAATEAADPSEARDDQDAAVAGPVRLAAVPDPDGEGDLPGSGPRPAVRLPSRRQKAHTHPLPVGLDDELFDQEAFGLAGDDSWHEPPLPLDLGGDAERPGDDQQDAAAPSLDDAPGHDEHAVGAKQAAGDRNHHNKRSARSGDKPRMPSWDDILLGVRRKSE